VFEIALSVVIGHSDEHTIRKYPKGLDHIPDGSGNGKRGFGKHYADGARFVPKDFASAAALNDP